MNVLRHISKRWRHLVLLSVCTLAGWQALPYLLPAIQPEPFVRTQASPRLLDNEGITLGARLNPDDQWLLPIENRDISRYLVDATIAAEDQRFHQHHGVDLIAIARAAMQNVTAGQVESGASTLTMQLANLGGHTSRTLTGKIAQAVTALRLDLALDKNAILNAYFNRAPYGRNLVGAEAASLRYFGKHARDLAIHEAALLAGLPKSPTRLDPLRNPEAARARRDYVLRRMRAEGFLSTNELDSATSQPLGAAWHELPDDAPHLAHSIDADTRTTLNARTQRRVSTLLRDHLKQYDGHIRNGACIVHDLTLNKTIAWVGSAGFHSVPGGQLDACTTPRSPGSALKPFVYGLAMEQQHLYPSERLLDDTLDYGSYAPENFTRENYGIVSASEALAFSLNVPAVQVIERTGVRSAHARLRGLGFTTLHEAAEHYGLGLVLGNCPVRLDELVAAYAAIAQRGLWSPISPLHPATPDVRVMEEGAARALMEMLDQPLPGDLDPNLIPASGRPPRVAWKTGTSTGHHDAWAVVFNAQYVVGVWLGNSDGRAHQALVGAKAALPLAGRIFRGLEVLPAPAWPAAGDALRSIDACAESGLPASPWCARRLKTLIPRMQYLHRRCDVHHPGEHGVIEHWPGSPRGWDLANIEMPAIRTQDTEATSLAIVSPADGATYVLTGDPNGDRIALRANARDTDTYWYVDGKFQGHAPLGRALDWTLTPGKHRITCTLADGLHVTATLFVEQI